ncbi:hypothetical protein DENSPDRAFT_254860 [Dentipellis sp. KUC8613]|nr:hypothetical protein DENSPDRAFT_254860 [Dentipellis sp. KUC8613]
MCSGWRARPLALWSRRHPSGAGRNMATSHRLRLRLRLTPQRRCVRVCAYILSARTGTHTVLVFGMQPRTGAAHYSAAARQVNTIIYTGRGTRRPQALVPPTSTLTSTSNPGF